MAERRTAIVVSGGVMSAHIDVARLPTADIVIAADAGLVGAAALGLVVDLIVGDLDSVPPAALDLARDRGVRIEEHPTSKDATDLELALRAALEWGATHVTVVDTRAGRLDQFLANVLLLGAVAMQGATVDALVDGAHLQVVTQGAVRSIAGSPGDLVTLLPIGGSARGVTTTGLQYPLRDETLEPGTTRGVSNVLSRPIAAVGLTSGCLLIVCAHEGVVT